MDRKLSRGGLALALGLACTAWAAAADWPTYRHDPARSGVTAERLALPLSLQWAFVPPAPPAAGWGKAEQGTVWKVGLPFRQSVGYDDAYQVAAVEDCVYFCASGEDKVYCLDAAQATIRWSVGTAAPPRCAPTVHDGNVYVGADDGCVYCLHAADGTPRWKLDAVPQSDHVIGQGRMMSLRPVRTGVAVADGIAYFAAGLYPNFGLSLHAVQAADGRRVWTQADFGRGDGLAAQGYLLTDQRRVVVPAGRAFPQVFDRRTGSLQGRITIGRTPPNGGSYAVLAGDWLLNGVNCMTAYDLAGVLRDKYQRPIFAPPAWSWLGAQAVVVDGETVYMVTDTDIFAVARATVAEACGATTGFETNRRPDWSKCQWRKTGQDVPDALILAGNVLLAGGKDKVAAYDAATGAERWSAEVAGRARGLAVANGRLLVSTTSGRIYCFGRGGSGKTIAPSVAAPPFPSDRLSAFYRQTAESIAAQAGGQPGFGLVIAAATGGRAGQLAYELAQRTGLHIQLLEPNEDRAAAARTALLPAGCYGTHVQVDCGSLASARYPPLFANLIVCEEAFFGGAIGTPPAELLRVLRPCGGLAFVGQPPDGPALGTAVDRATLAAWLHGLGPAYRVRQAAAWATIERGKLPGAADWSHQGATPGNTYCDEDRLVKPPFGLLWFGAPGPHDTLDRHARGSAPLVVDGRLFATGIDRLAAYDVYNGTLLWQRHVPGIGREHMPLNGSNIVATDRVVYAAVDDRCLSFDAISGQPLRVYDLPPRNDRQKRLWGWLAVADGLLLGSRSETSGTFRNWPAPSGNTSEALFALDPANGELRWICDAKGIPHNAIAVLDRRLFFIDDGGSPPARPAATGGKPATNDKPPAADVRRLVALDLPSGRELWRQEADVSNCVVHPSFTSGDCCGGTLALMAKGKTLVLCGSPFHEDHELKPFRNGLFARRSLTAFDAESGRQLWTRPGNYQTRPIIVGDWIFAEPWVFDLATGAAKTDDHGKPLELFRGSGCGGFAASASTLFFRKGAISYRELLPAGETQPLVNGQRPSCWISFVPAGGIVVAPEGSAGCTCTYSIQGSVALYPKALAVGLPADTNHDQPLPGR